MRKYLLSFFSSFFLLAGMATAPDVLATTTVINFDTTPDGTVIRSNTQITDQYQSVGVTVSGATAINVASTIWATTNTPPNFALAETSAMIFTLNPSIAGNVQSMSAFILTGGTSPLTISAYDSSGSLVGQQTVASVIGSPELLSVTSSGNPIATVEIQGPSSYFAVDTVTFTSSIPLAKFAAMVFMAPKFSAFSATENFTLGANSPALDPATQAVTLSIGALAITIPAGSFVKDDLPRTSAYVFRGKLNNVDLYVWLSPTGSPRSYLLFVLGGGYAFKSGLSTVPVVLTIDNNSGSVNVAPHYVTLVPVGP